MKIACGLLLLLGDVVCMGGVLGRMLGRGQLETETPGTSCPLCSPTGSDSESWKRIQNMVTCKMAVARSEMADAYDRFRSTPSDYMPLPLRPFDPCRDYEALERWSGSANELYFKLRYVFFTDRVIHLPGDSKAWIYNSQIKQFWDRVMSATMDDAYLSFVRPNTALDQLAAKKTRDVMEWLFEACRKEELFLSELVMVASLAFRRMGRPREYYESYVTQPPGLQSKSKYYGITGIPHRYVEHLAKCYPKLRGIHPELSMGNILSYRCSLQTIEAEVHFFKHVIRACSGGAGPSIHPIALVLAFYDEEIMAFVHGASWDNYYEPNSGWFELVICMNKHIQTLGAMYSHYLTSEELERFLKANRDMPEGGIY